MARSEIWDHHVSKNTPLAPLGKIRGGKAVAIGEYKNCCLVQVAQKPYILPNSFSSEKPTASP